MAKTFSIQDFYNKFPDKDACLEHLMQVRYGSKLNCPKCEKYGKFTRIRKIPAYQCSFCGHHIHPMVGTPFQDTHIDLQKWFYALYLFTTTRHGVPAKELERQLGVTYKTAWRIGHEIRKYMGVVNNKPLLAGIIEIDETYIGGKKPGKRGRGASGKTIVVGLLEKNGSLITEIVPDVKRKTLHGIINKKVSKGSTLHTDELLSYRSINKHNYEHETVNHSTGEFVRNDVHVNGLEGFWGQIKRSVLGTHVMISAKHMDKYLSEFGYRYNMRHTPENMFPRLLESF